jgi:hypothetical protein
MTTPVRQSVGFPTVANIRKGTPKKKIKKTYDNETKIVEVMGVDLKNKFRIDFLPGTADARKDWHAVHEKDYVKYPENFVTPDGYEVDILHAMIPLTKVWDCWEWQNETYDASGRRIAIADGDHYIMKKDPLTGEILIKDGQPYEKFNVGDAVTYERNGQKKALAMKSIGRLKLFLPEIGRLVSFVLRTSSYIDSRFIFEQLAAIQNIADMLNGGIAGGIPLDIYRVERDSPWQKDGQSHKGKQWFIQIEANKLWVQAAIQRMNQFALTGSNIAGLLQPTTIDLGAMPEQAFTETDDEAEPGGETITGEVTDLDLTPVTEKIEEAKDEIPVMQMYRYNDDHIIQPVRKILGYTVQEAAQTLYEAYKKKLIAQNLTIAEAEQFARDLISPK